MLNARSVTIFSSPQPAGLRHELQQRALRRKREDQPCHAFSSRTAHHRQLQLLTQLAKLQHAEGENRGDRVDDQVVVE